MGDKCGILKARHKGTEALKARHKGTEGQRGKGMRGEIKSYRDLIIWQKSMSLVTEIYKTTKSFPSDEIYGLTSQLRRCAVSIPSNIAEGYGRNSTQDYIRFLNISTGAVYELQTQLEISFNLGYINGEAFHTLYESTRELERTINALIRKLINKRVIKSQG